MDKNSLRFVPLVGVRAVQIGLALQELKLSVSYGGWLKFFRANVECPGLSLSTADKYMALAKRVRLIALKDGLLLEDPAEGYKALKDSPELLKKALGCAASAESWAELDRAIGLLCQDKPSGSKRGRGKARRIVTYTPNAALQAAVTRWAEERIREWREVIIEKNFHIYMSEDVRNKLLATIEDCMVRIENGPPKKEEGHEHTAS